MSQPTIAFRNVSKTFSRNNVAFLALDRIDLTIEKGDIFGVIGTSGAGKSTLLRLINHLETPSQGEVRVNGESLQGVSKPRLNEVKKDIGMIFQHFNLLNAKTVFHNVAIPLILQGRDKAFIRTRVEELLAFVSLSDKANSFPNELSGGQKQRVGIARALATNPSVLLLKEINQRYGITIVLITHEMSVVQKICNRVAVMAQGRIVEQGDVLSLFGNPQHPVSASFVQSVIHERLPEQTLALLAEQETARSLRLEFIGITAQQPIINRLIRDFPVEVNILFANMSEVQSTILGFMIVQLKGDAAHTEAAIHFLRQSGVKITDV
jgi:D-methionine transport system ATP-binding protein